MGAAKVAGKTGLDAVKRAVEAAAMNETEKQKEARRLVELIIGADIPPEEWIEILKEIEHGIKQEQKSSPKGGKK